MLKLYDCSTAPSPRRARMFLAEKGLEWETIEVDLRSAEQLKPDFLAINPKATVPALVTENGEVIAENLAIAAYEEVMNKSATEGAQNIGARIDALRLELPKDNQEARNHALHPYYLRR